MKNQRSFLKVISDITAFLFTLSLFVVIIYYYNKIPETIPVHYNATGEADGFGHKRSIWLIPFVSLFMFSGLFLLSRFIERFRLKQNGQQTKQKVGAIYLIRAINIIISSGFFYIGLSTIQVSLKITTGLSVWFLPVFLGALVIVIGLFIYWIKRNK
ncbi:MAG: DUF1648 domain-containing protein [Bacteroidetes bacterium]|nr:DUF1648 domain-containing protein [Bacteroidota bacterium]